MDYPDINISTTSSTNNIPDNISKSALTTNAVTDMQQQLSKLRLPLHQVAYNHTRCWQSQLADTINDVDELLTILDLKHLYNKLYIPKSFGLRVPRSFVAKMQKGDAHDPLLKQVLPLNKELKIVEGYNRDPLQENLQNPTKGLLHKYRSRVLITLTGACAVHCRYCFRQHFDYQANIAVKQQIDQIKDYIIAHPEVNEVILSGGDPLSLSPRRLNLWLETFESLLQISTIRIHTRLPVVIPERLDDELNKRLQASRCHIVMVIHANHANEIDEHTSQRLAQTRQHGVMLFNQAVLLKGVNADVSSQVALSYTLFGAGVMPYYLHILDKVAGSAHFAITKTEAVKLYWQMLAQLPGYLVPKLVQELPHKPFKTPVNLY